MPNIVSYKWYIDNALVSNTSTLQYTFNDTGVYEIKLEITDSDNNTAINTLLYTVVSYITTYHWDIGNDSYEGNTVPVVFGPGEKDIVLTISNNLGDEATINIKKTVYLNVNCPFYFDFGDGTGSYDNVTSHTYTEPGVYTVRLLLNEAVIKEKIVTVLREALSLNFIIEQFKNENDSIRITEEEARNTVIIEQEGILEDEIVIRYSSILLADQFKNDNDIRITEQEIKKELPVSEPETQGLILPKYSSALLIEQFRRPNESYNQIT